jgi:nucleotide-binding universal stress UspA family protein
MRIILAVDGSKDSQEAAAYLKELPLPPSTAIRIVSVVSLPVFAPDVASAPQLKSSFLDWARTFVWDARKALEARGVAVETDVALGDPRTEIVRQSEEWGADLVVLGARGLGKVKRFLQGSVSDAVARHARCAVLIVKGRRRKFGSVLVAMDGSEDSFQAARFLQSLALPRQTRVRLLSVVERLRYPTTAPKAVQSQLVGMIKELEAERRGELDKVLERAAAQLEDKITRVTRYTPTGDPADEIVATASAFDADLVVVGARGLGGLERALLGSVSEKVLHHARCPVLIVKQRSKA